MDRSLDGVGLDDRRTGLVGEQIDGMGGVVPQQVVGPRARLAERVDVLAAEEIGLHVHLLDVELAGLDLPVHPLVARIEAPGVADHGHLAAGLCSRDHRLGVGPGVGQRDLHLDVLARLQAGDGLLGVHLGRRAQDHRIDLGQRQGLGEIAGDMRDAVLKARRPGSARASRPITDTTSTP